MARSPEKVNFQLSVTSAEKEMIKADAKAMGMPVARYVVTLCNLHHDTAMQVALIKNQPSSGA